MIAGGDDIHARGKNFFGDLGRDAGSARRVFTVRHDDVDAMLHAQQGHQRLDRPASRLTDNVANEKKFHRRESKA